jgi:glucose-1-phosphate cytidylyltransferase
MTQSEIPVVILCGGRGIQIDASGKRQSKGLVRVAGEAMIVHLMRHFCRHGFRRFILACGSESDGYRELMAGIGAIQDGRILLSRGGLTGSAEIVDTGIEAQTGQRIRAVRPLLEDVPTFWVTYSDTLSPVDLGEMVRAHRSGGKVASCLGARLPTRFRILGMRRGEAMVRGFANRPVIQNDFINGGFYLFQPEIFGDRYLGAPGTEVLEEAVLAALASDGQLVAFPYEGPWQYLDSERDLGQLDRVVALLKEMA